MNTTPGDRSQLSRILLENAAIVTLDADETILASGTIAVDGDRILHIGEPPADWQADERLDLGGHLIMPGFWNGHTHAAMSFTRAIGDDLPIERWFNERIWVVESGLTEEDVYWGTMLAAAEMIRGGTVGFADHYFHLPRVAQVVEQSGMKALLASAQFGLGQEVDLSFEDALEVTLHFQGAADGRIRTCLGPHSPYICPPEFLEKVAGVARDEGLAIHIHLSESPEQLHNSLERHGMTPVAHLERLGVLQVPLLAAHCTAVTEEDVALLAARGVVPVQCPTTHMKLAMGVTPVPQMLEQKIPVALGTDGPGSTNRLSLLAEARLAALLQKSHLGDATVMAGQVPLRMATRHGAQAMGFVDSGRLQAGMAADLIVLDLQRPHLQPVNSLVGNLLYAARDGDVVHTMVDGRWLMRDRQLLTLDEPRILAEAARRAPAMFARGTAQLRRYDS